MRVKGVAISHYPTNLCPGQIFTSYDNKKTRGREVEQLPASRLSARPEKIGTHYTANQRWDQGPITRPEARPLPLGRDHRETGPPPGEACLPQSCGSRGWPFYLCLRLSQLQYSVGVATTKGLCPYRGGFPVNTGNDFNPSKGVAIT